MALFIASFVAGILTILAPCVLPLLPVTLGGAVAGSRSARRPLVIIGALAASVFAFTLLLKGSTALITVSPDVWTYVSAGILAAFGLTLVFPESWARLMLKVPGHGEPDAWLARGYRHRGEWWADILVGAALGPVFTTCSPTFFLIVATVLPQSLAAGIADLLGYIAGLSASLLAVAYAGQRLVGKMEWATDPYGWFRRGLGGIFIIMAILISLGLDKQIESAILRSGFFDVTALEQPVRQTLEGANREGKTAPGSGDQASYPAYTEISQPAGFINSAPFKLADYIGKKVILIDFIDYSCINCERTFPFLDQWWSAYKDQGLLIVAIHTPEFSFEKDPANVAAAARRFGLEFPIVLDNGYGTWNAYQNQYWPHKFLIDIHGRVVYDHVGEGGYDETEAEIVKQLGIRKMVLGESGSVVMSSRKTEEMAVAPNSPETYFGALRNEYFGNGQPFQVGDGSFSVPSQPLEPNAFYLGGRWKVSQEYAEGQTASTSISYLFSALNMYIVAASADGSPVQARVLIDGAPISPADAGADVQNGILTVGASRLYHIYTHAAGGQHRLDLIFLKKGIRAYTFTFG